MSAPAAIRVLGIDPGLNITGYGVLEVARGSVKVCEAGVVRGRTKGSLAARLQEIHSGVAEVIASLAPSAMAIGSVSISAPKRPEFENRFASRNTPWISE